MNQSCEIQSLKAKPILFAMKARVVNGPKLGTFL